MARVLRHSAVWLAALALAGTNASAQDVALVRAGEPVQLDIRAAGEHSIRVTLKPVGFAADFPFTPALATDRSYAPPAISLRSVAAPVERRVGNLHVTVQPAPLSIAVRNAAGERVQHLVFESDGRVSFDIRACCRRADRASTSGVGHACANTCANRSRSRRRALLRAPAVKRLEKQKRGVEVLGLKAQLKR